MRQTYDPREWGYKPTRKQILTSKLGNLLSGLGIAGVVLLWVGSILASLAMPIFVIYVVFHFVSKYW